MLKGLFLEIWHEWDQTQHPVVEQMPRGGQSEPREHSTLGVFLSGLALNGTTNFSCMANDASGNCVIAGKQFSFFFCSLGHLINHWILCQLNWPQFVSESVFSLLLVMFTRYWASKVLALVSGCFSNKLGHLFITLYLNRAEESEGKQKVFSVCNMMVSPNSVNNGILYNYWTGLVHKIKDKRQKILILLYADTIQKWYYLLKIVSWFRVISDFCLSQRKHDQSSKIQISLVYIIR